ncbi:hypothetical protein PR048_014039 [Dryococelus australis]|uniref:Uncharacterized protein n=1 Tax=Dryococelus australis TaxID=614101 RepID=A0ABQ9HTW0_9NEOP|nr:hypothetical protein PR048_014039 [Dryococelus australis]
MNSNAFHFNLAEFHISNPHYLQAKVTAEKGTVTHLSLRSGGCTSTNIDEPTNENMNTCNYK